MKDLLPSPFPDSQQYSSSDRETLPEFSSNEPLYFFMDKLTKGQETVLKEKLNNFSAISVSQPEFALLLLPPIYLIMFSRNSCYWHEWIQWFEERVHLKDSFSDSIRMEHLISVLDGETKRVVCTIRRNANTFALKALIRELENPYLKQL